MIGSSLWDGPCKEKVRGAGQEGSFPLFTVSLLCVNGTFFYGSLRGRSYQTQVPEPRERAVQGLSSQLKLNLTTQPTLQARHSSSPSSVTPPISRQVEPDTLSHPSVLTRTRREEGNCKTKTTAPLKPSEQRWFPVGDGSERH